MARQVGLLVTCLADLMRPRIAGAALQLIREAGFDPVVPGAQTCCGQPALNSGMRSEARDLMRKLAAEFSACDAVVAPSGSCIGAIATHMPDLFDADEPGSKDVRELAAKSSELSQFLVAEGYQPQKAANPLRIAFHDSCAGLRELGIKQEPRSLLEGAGHELVPLEGEEVCCGFGGTFSVKFGEVSSKMADDKCGAAVASEAEVLALGDLGCMLNIEGRMSRRGETMPVRHWAELLVEG